MSTPAIGKLVQLNLPQIFDHCAAEDPEEITNLFNKDYSKRVFKLGYALLKTPVEAELVKEESGHSRYWAPVHSVLDHDVRVTSQWYPRHVAPFLIYLLGKGLTPIGISPEMVDAEINEFSDTAAGKKKASPGSARYRRHAIGNAQNSAVRFVLGSLGHESFTQKHWLAVKQRFGFACAYCSSKRQLVMDHAVPISIGALGEHRLGNLVPACHDCNAAKGMKRYDEYLREQRDRPDAAAHIATIDDHLAEHDYDALTDSLSTKDADQVRQLLDQLRAQIKDAASATVAAINDVVTAQQTKP